jgi:3-oxoacyl-[acyl-carrier-protein] synthase II
VAVTGIGAVTPLGHSFRDTWKGIVEGRRPAGLIKSFDASQFPTTFAYEVTGFKLSARLVAQAEASQLNRGTEFGVQAVDEALEAAGLPDAAVDGTRTGVVMGVGMCSPDYDWYADVMVGERFGDPTLRDYGRFFPNTFGTIVARMAKARGGAVTVHTACASSGQALGEAYEAIAWGDLDTVVTGGADSMINPFHVAGFSLLGALSRRNESPASASRPFDVERDGFVLGEGACALVLEEWEQAKRRGAKILGEVLGYGVSESAWRVTDLHPEGRGPIEAMRDALVDAGVRPEQVGYVNAHGTSTALNDRCEALAVGKVFGAHAEPAGGALHVGSTKGATGHLISAAGALEAALCVQALAEQTLPPSVNLVQPDPECAVKLCPTRATASVMTHALSNSVGFGGSNTAIVVGRVER